MEFKSSSFLDLPCVVTKDQYVQYLIEKMTLRKSLQQVDTIAQRGFEHTFGAKLYLTLNGITERSPILSQRPANKY